MDDQDLARQQMDANSKTRYHRLSQIYILIPALIYGSIIVTFIGASVLEMPTQRGLLYVMLAVYSLISAVLTPVPCVVLSIIGMVNAGKTMKENRRAATWMIAAGVVEMVIGICLMVFVVRTVLFASV